MSERHSTRTSGVKRRTFLTAAGTAGTVGLAGCSLGGDGGGAITFGQPALLSGDLQFIQPSVSAAADLARTMINDAGGPLDREIEIVRRDTARRPPQGREVIRKFRDNDDAVVINGLTSTVAVPLWDFIQSLNIPVVSMYSGTRFLDSRGGDGETPGDTSDDGWYWRTTGADSQHTAAAAVHAKRSGATKVAVINEKSAGARTWAQAFLDGARVQDGVEVADLGTDGRFEVEGGKSSYRSDLEEFFGNDFDLFAVAMGAPSAIALLQEWKDAGYGRRPMVSNPLKNPEIVEQLGSRLADDGLRVAVPAIAGPYADTYRSEFRSFVEDSGDYESDLGQNNWSASSYDAITVSALAIQRAGSADPVEIQKNIGPVARPPGTEVSTFEAGKAALEAGDEINYVGAQTRVDFNEFGDVFNLAKVYELSPDGWSQVDEVTAEKIQSVIAKERQMG